jgi:hypothetical protein
VRVKKSWSLLRYVTKVVSVSCYFQRGKRRYFQSYALCCSNEFIENGLLYFTDFLQEPMQAVLVP